MNATTLTTVAHGAASAFTMMAAYITLVEAPARRAVPAAEALRQFQASFPRAAVIMPMVIAVSGAGALGAWYFGGLKRHRILAGGALMLSIIPFTYANLMPINRRLLDSATASALGGEELRSLLNGWEDHHKVRTVIGAVAMFALLPRLPAWLAAKL